MKIAVTKKHIKDGKPEDSHKCPVALAIQDALKAQGIRNSDVSVDYKEIFISFTIKPNKATADFIEAFDQTYDETRAKVNPFEFELKN